MAINLQCECGNTFHVFDEQAGQMVRCPVCGKEQPAPKAAPSGLAELTFVIPGVQVTSGKAIASMVLGILSIVLMCSIFTGVPAIILGILSLGEIEKSRVITRGRGMAIAGIITGAIGSIVCLGAPIALLLPAVQSAREAARRAQCTNNMKQIGLALLSYESANTQFPPPAITDKNGKPLLSWRVSILPFLGEQSLYSQFHLDEPWDSPHNRSLLAGMPAAYRCPSLNDPNPSHTNYKAVVGPGTVFEALGGVSIRKIADGTSNTLLVVETNGPIDWSKPDDYPVGANPPASPPASPHPGGFNALFADGSLRFLSNRITPQELRARATRGGGEPVPSP